MTVRSVVVAAHRWLGLFAAALWLLQAATGVLIVFHWELDDAITAGAHRSTDWAAIEARVSSLHPSSIWTTAAAPDRYDVNVADGTIRIDGGGDVLRVRHDDEKFVHGGIVDTLVVLHQTLLAGDTGRSVIGISGTLLFSNLILGVIAAWPRRRQWTRALSPSMVGSKVARLYSWHRAAGLWLAIPALCTVGAGVLLAFDESTARVLDAGVVEPVQPSAGPFRIGLAAAIERAAKRFPGAAVSGVRFPSHENAIWLVTMKQPGELQRAYGKSRVYVSAMDGQIVADADALTVTPAHRFADLLFPFHTGEIGGLGGRLLVLTLGTWLLTMITLGLSLWSARRTAKRRPVMVIGPAGS